MLRRHVLKLAAITPLAGLFPYLAPNRPFLNLYKGEINWLVNASNKPRQMNLMPNILGELTRYQDTVIHLKPNTIWGVFKDKLPKKYREFIFSTSNNYEERWNATLDLIHDKIPIKMWETNPANGKRISDIYYNPKIVGVTFTHPISVGDYCPLGSIYGPNYKGV